MASDYEGVLTDSEATLDDVDVALGRLAAGTYGACSTCGAAIEEERLVETPTIGTCSAHTP